MRVRARAERRLPQLWVGGEPVRHRVPVLRPAASQAGAEAPARGRRDQDPRGPAREAPPPGRRAADPRRGAASRRGRRRFEELATKPVATGLLLLAFAVMFVVYRASDLVPTELGVIFGTPDGEPWRYLTAPFFFDDAGYLFVCGLAIALFLPPIERRIGSVASLILALACGALGMLAARAHQRALGDELPARGRGERDRPRRARGLRGHSRARAPGGPGGVVRPDRRGRCRRGAARCCRSSRTSPIPWAGLAGAIVGALCGLTANAGRRRARGREQVHARSTSGSTPTWSSTAPARTTSCGGSRTRPRRWGRSPRCRSRRTRARS